MESGKWKSSKAKARVEEVKREGVVGWKCGVVQAKVNLSLDEIVATVSALRL